MSTVLLNSQVCSKFSSPFKGLQVEHKVYEIHFNYNDLKREMILQNGIEDLGPRDQLFFNILGREALGQA
jgi:hypothetical protein